MTHASTDTRVLRCLDGISFSFDILEHIYTDLFPTCTKIKLDQKALIPALWQCWSFVDVIHRIREIAEAIPGLSKDERPLREFLTETELLHTFRNYIQHLREELLKREGNPFPVWGSLSWVDSEDQFLSHTVLIGTQLPGIGYSGCVFDNFENRWVSKVCLGAYGRTLNFDPIYASCQKFRGFILPWMLSAYKPGVRVQTKFPIISARIQRGPVPAQ